MTTNLHDQHGRVKRKLRLSLTDRCNYRCTYCMPETPEWLPKSSLLSLDDFVSLSRTFIKSGITHLRLTGGEPLLYPQLIPLVQQLNQLRSLGLEKLSLTTNASLLHRHAQALKDAGLDDLNISLDSLDPKRIDQLSRGSANLAEILTGIDAARAAGLPIKINAFLVQGENDHEVVDLVNWAATENLTLRFIEFMPLEGGGQWQRDKVVSEASILDALREHFDVKPCAKTSDPARYFTVNQRNNPAKSVSTVGIISTITNPFCNSCDRLRLTASGELYTCLFAQSGTPLRPLIDSPELVTAIETAVHKKAKGFAEQGTKQGAEIIIERPITMHTLGG